MSKVRLREANQEQGNGAAPAITLQPLRVAGVVVRKVDLVEALRVYVPGLSDLQVTEDGEHFWLMVKEGMPNEDTAATS